MKKKIKGIPVPTGFLLPDTREAKLFRIIKFLYTKDKTFDSKEDWREALVKLLEETI